METAVIDKAMRTLADVSGIIVDRTLTPEKIIGQAWIISKSRMVVLASSVANYADAPWALLVKFPYPDLVFSVKAVSLHPEFNRRAARDYYLAQANELVSQTQQMDNDIATITIEAEIPDLQPDRVQELNRALSLPLNISSQDLSGVMRAGDTGNILQKAITSQRNGVLTFYDERKVPFARVQIKNGRILRAVFQNLQNEYAVCELMWRKPGGNFVLQTSDNLNWSGIQEIAMSTDQLAAEASRRTQDLPRMIDALGGPNVRYVRTRPQVDLNQVNQQVRWIVERVWPVLDGHMPLHKLSERLAVDTYTALQAIWEMKHHGFVAMANFEQFHRSGQVGPPLTPGHEVNLKFWDNLQAFYLDDVSTAPVTLQGNFFGPTLLLTPGTLLHTMPVPCKYGAIVLKEGRLVGLHNGKYVADLQSPPPFPLSQMSWIGTLSDMSAKRMRTVAADLEAEPEDIPASTGRGTATGLKARGVSGEPSAQAPSDMPSAVPPPVSNEPEILQKFSKIQMGGAGGAVGLLVGMILACATMGPKPQAAPVPAPVTAATATTTGTTTGEIGNKQPAPVDAFKDVLKMACFRDNPFAPFQFADTTKETAPRPSFGLESEKNNQKIYFVVWPNAATSEAVDSNMTQPPYIPVKKNNQSTVVPIAQGTSPVHDFLWKVERYSNNSGKDTVVLVGAYPAADRDKSILVVAMPFKGEGDLDFKNTISMVERMFNDVGGPSGTGSSASGSAYASDADLLAYRQKIKDVIKASYRAPDDADRANKCVINFVVDSTGNISKLELKYSSGMEEVDRAVKKAISAKVPYPSPPSTKTGEVPMRLTVENNGDVTIDEP